MRSFLSHDRSWAYRSMLLVTVCAGYVASHALAPGAHYHDVFRFVGATAFMGFALGQMPQSIWY